MDGQTKPTKLANRVATVTTAELAPRRTSATSQMLARTATPQRTDLDRLWATYLAAFPMTPRDREEAIRERIARFASRQASRTPPRPLDFEIWSDACDASSLANQPAPVSIEARYITAVTQAEQDRRPKLEQHVEPIDPRVSGWIQTLADHLHLRRAVQ